MAEQQELVGIRLHELYRDDLEEYLSRSSLSKNTIVFQTFSEMKEPRFPNGIGGDGVIIREARGAGDLYKALSTVAHSAAAAYVGRALVDLVRDLVKEWLKNRPEKYVEIELYGPNGEVVQIVKANNKIGSIKRT